MLAVIAGQGNLPMILARALPDQPHVASLEGFEPEGLAPDRRFRIEQLGSLIADFREMGVTEVCFAGAIRRPVLDPSRIDAATMPLVPRMMAALQKGDDGALREVIAIFEDAGIAVRGAHELSPDLLPQHGVYSSLRPEDYHETDARRAAETLSGLGPLDIGQSCVVHRGQVLTIEGTFGTDWMLASLENRPDGQGGIFYKAAKPGQDRRIDLPAVGPDTVDAAKKAGLDGIVVEEGSVMVLDLAEVEKAADEKGLFVWVRKP